jgi:O-antigen biosynthesis protein
VSEYRIKVVDVELDHPLPTLEGLDGYRRLRALVRLHGSPLGYVDLPIARGRCSAASLEQAIIDKLSRPLMRRLLSAHFGSENRVDPLRVSDLMSSVHPAGAEKLPTVTVAVCTRDRTAELQHCLDGLERLDYPNLEILVVDNAPSSDATRKLVGARYPRVHYVLEPRPGLDWARNRAISVASGEILAYTDDDVVVDPGWVRALARAFADDPEAMAVTGLVVPFELETQAQQLFEDYGGFGRGFERRRVSLDRGSRDRWKQFGTGQYGTGANMAYRRELFDRIGLFDTALDVGTVTNGGGDLEMFFRVLEEGYVLVYEPSAVVRHRHRSDLANLRTQITNDGLGFAAYVIRSCLAYPHERGAFLRLGLWWLWSWNRRHLWDTWLRPGPLRDLVLAELRGAVQGLGRYPKSRRAIAEMGEVPAPLRMAPTAHGADVPRGERQEPGALAVRTADLAHPLKTLSDITDYFGVRLYVSHGDRILGKLDVANGYRPLDKDKLAGAIVRRLPEQLLQLDPDFRRDPWQSAARTALAARRTANPEEATASTRLSDEFSVSVVVATLNRPDDLRSCLRSLTAQDSSRRVEIIVVDNDPTSGLTPPVVAEFPDVLLVSEPRRGLSYARNAGIAASRGEIVVTTDDDVTTPPEWLERLIVQFARPEVGIVTGNVLPGELDTAAQRLFEAYGGLGRGFKRREVDQRWFGSSPRRAVETWKLGATANAAFRANLFRQPEIGLFDEALGAGTPTGCSEDTYLFYKAIKAGHTLVYEPSAFVWHRHRRDMPALRRQLYAYSKGHVAYQLTTLIRDGDLRAVFRLLVELPRLYLWRAHRRLRGWSDYPMSLLLVEVVGTIAGPWALWRSRRRVSRDGRSAVLLEREEAAARLPPGTLSSPPQHNVPATTRGL